MKALVGAFNQEKALVGAFSVITNLRMELFEALQCNEQASGQYVRCGSEVCCERMMRFRFGDTADENLDKAISVN